MNISLGGPWKPAPLLSYVVKPEPPVLLRGSSEKEGPAYRLSVLDTLQEPMPDTSIAMWYGGAGIDPDRLQRALRYALGKYPVLAGRLKRMAADEVPYVDCNDAGASLRVSRLTAREGAQGLADPVTPRWNVPGICTDKTQVQKCIDQVPEFDDCVNKPNQPLLRVKLTTFEWENNKHSDKGAGSVRGKQRPLCVLGVSALAALLDTDSLLVFLRAVSLCYQQWEPSAGSLDRVAPFRRLLASAKRGNAKEWPIPPIPCQPSTSSLRSLFTKVVNNVIGTASAVLRLTAADIKGLESSPDISVEDAVAADLWYLLVQLRKALGMETKATVAEDTLPPSAAAQHQAASKQTPSKPQWMANDSGPDTAQNSAIHPMSALGTPGLHLTHIFVPTCFRGCEWLAPDYWGNANLLTRISLDLDELEKLEMQTVARLIDSGRHAPVDYLVEGVQWLTQARSSRTRVQYAVGTETNTEVLVETLSAARIKEVVFDVGCNLIFVNLPPRKLAWFLTLVPSGREESVPVVDVHMSLPRVAMEVIQADMKERLLGSIAWGT